ncbi:ABC transporter permease [Streptosporangiaceae bacterium NEAU-GS5]|nr:ABC transporter permease [Streptosporangiaceae bacterium NEAU-GS5]
MANAIVQGLLLGGLYALFACGLSLVFGVMRVINLAHGDFAVVAAYLAVLFGGLQSGWLVVPLFAVAGYFLQRTLIQASIDRGPLTTLLVTFGLSVVIENLLLQLFSADSHSLSASSGSIRLTDQISVGRLSLAIFALAVVVLLGLQALLSRTGTGRLVRAVADDPEAARLSGVAHRHILGLAAGAAFATVALAGLAFGAYSSFAPASGTGRLLYAFEAVVIGGLGSLWGTLAGGMVLGVAQSIGAELNLSYAVIAGHLVFLAVLALRPEGLTGARSGAVARRSWPSLRLARAVRQAVRAKARQPDERARGRHPTKRSWWPVAGFVAVAVLAYLPYAVYSGTTDTLVNLFILLTLATMWNLLAGYAGLVSVGQQAFVGLGAYFTLIVAQNGMSPFTALPVAAIACGVAALAVSFLVFRLRGGYFAIATWVVADVCQLAISRVPALGGGTGQSLPGLSGIDPALLSAYTYWGALGVAALALATAWLLLRARIGLALRAVRDDEIGARSLGVRVGRARRVVYVVAGMGCGAAGAVLAISQLNVEPTSAFSVGWSAQMIFCTIIGGIDTLEGPIIGAVLFFGLQQALSQYGAWYLVVLGLIAVAVSIWAPRGLLKRLAETVR